MLMMQLMYKFWDSTYAHMKELAGIASVLAVLGHSLCNATYKYFDN